jgi:predicted transposase YbfD/YdcC
MGWFPAVFQWLMGNFTRSFEIITYDAGACSADNARLVDAAQKGYLFSVKANQPSLLQLARQQLGSREDAGDAQREGEARTADRAQGKAVTRELFRYPLTAADAEVALPGAQELWRVRQTSVTRDAAGTELERVVSERYFVTNRTFDADQSLRLVRLHWGIENGPNWAMDEILGEDAGSPCLKGHGLENVSWLRLLTVNLLAMFRTRLPRAHGEAPSYRDAGRALKAALDQVRLPEELLASLA